MKSRENCTCPCHRGVHVMHIAACCSEGYWPEHYSSEDISKLLNKMPQTTSPKKQVRVVSVDEFTRKNFKVEEGEVYDVQHEQKGEIKYGYLIYTPNGRAIVMYQEQVEVIN